MIKENAAVVAFEWNILPTRLCNRPSFEFLFKTDFLWEDSKMFFLRQISTTEKKNAMNFNAGFVIFYLHSKMS